MRGQRFLTYLLSRRYAYAKLQGALLFAGVVLTKDQVVAAAEEFLSAAVAGSVGHVYQKPDYVEALLQETSVDALRRERLPRRLNAAKFDEFLGSQGLGNVWPESEEDGEGPLLRAVASVVRDPEVRDAVELMCVKDVSVIGMHETLRKTFPQSRVRCSVQELELYVQYVAFVPGHALQDRSAELEQEHTCLEQLLLDTSGILDDDVLRLRQAAADRLRLVNRLTEELESLRSVLETGTSLHSLDLLESQLKALTTGVFNQLSRAASYNPELLEAYAKLAAAQLNVVKEKRTSAPVQEQDALLDDEDTGPRLHESLEEIPVDEIPTLTELRLTVGNDNLMASPHGGYMDGADPDAEDDSEKGAL